MANEIIQGDSGTVLSLTIQDDSQVVDLTNATVEVAIKFKATGILKQATITNPMNGICEITLDETDIPHEGVYSFQATVRFADGKKFSSNIERFTVLKKLNYTPNVGGGNSNIGGSATNGNILINGLDVKVYDDSAIKSEINSLKNGKHTHSNLEDLERLGINANNNLTIDGIELATGGTGETHNHANQTTLDKLTDDGTNLLFNGSPISGGSGGTIPSNVIYFEDWVAGETVTIDTGNAPPPADTTAPNNVTNLTTSNLTATSITLSWIASTSTDVSGYDVYNGSTLLGTITGTSYSVSGLTANTAYTFIVKAKDNSNNISSGVSVNVTTSSVVDTTAPNPVTNLTVGTVSSNSIPVSWTLSSSSDVANYEVAYSTDGTNYTVSSAVVNASSTSYTVSGLTSSTNYTIRVIAIDGAGNRSIATTVSGTTSAPADTTSPVLTITPATTFADSQTVTMSVNETADIWYTTDGSDPVNSGTRVKYSTALTLTATTTIKAYAVDTAANASGVQTVTYTKQTATTQVAVYPENGYLVMPVNRMAKLLGGWSVNTSFTNTSFTTIINDNAFSSSLFDLSDLTTLVKVGNIPYVDYGLLSTTNNECLTVNGNKPYVKTLSSNGTDKDTVLTYLQNTHGNAKVKLNSSYKTYAISSNISNVSTRATSNNGGQYFKCTLLDGIGTYTGGAVEQFNSIGYDMQPAYSWTHVRENIKINSDATLEMVVPAGTFTTIDQASVSAYLASKNIKIYY